MTRLELFSSIIGWIITGSVAGYIASALLRAERQGCIVNIVLGVVGAFVGGFVMHNILLPQGITGLGFLDAILNAIIGAVLVLVVIEIILPGKQLGVRKEKPKRSRRRRR